MNAAVVPDPSERWITWIPVDGRLAPELSFLMAWSFQVLICEACQVTKMLTSFQVLILPAKMPATVSGESLRLATPERLYSTAMPPPDQGTVVTWPPLATAPCSSVADIGTSEAPKSTVPAVNCCMPAPEPTPWYVTVAPEHLPWKSLIHCWAMFCTNVEPAPEIVPGSHAMGTVVPELELFLLLLLPHAAATIDNAASTATSDRLRLIGFIPRRALPGNLERTGRGLVALG